MTIRTDLHSADRTVMTLDQRGLHTQDIRLQQIWKELTCALFLRLDGLTRHDEIQALFYTTDNQRRI